MGKFQGTGVAIVTPFNENGSIDYSGLKNLLDYTIQGEIEYIVSLGTTGESATLTENERQAVWEYTLEVVEKRVPVIAGIGGNVTHEVVETLQRVEGLGFDAILSVSPYYNKPTQAGIYEHYRTISENTSLPIMLYNVPSRTGSNMTAETILRLAHNFKNIIGIKEASDNFNQFNEIIKDKPRDFLFISGDDPIVLPLIAMGAVGVISVVGNVLPRPFSNMVRMCLEGKFVEARVLHYRMIELIKLLFIESNPSGVKAALKYLGICENYLRLPLVKVSENVANKINKELALLLEFVELS